MPTRRDLETSTSISEEKIEKIINNSSANENIDISNEFKGIDRLKSFSPMITDASYYWVKDHARSSAKKWQRIYPSQIDGKNKPENMLVYTGNDSDTWIAPAMMSSSRIGNKNLADIVSGPGTDIISETDQGVEHHGRGRGIQRSTKQKGFIVMTKMNLKIV